MVNVLLGAAESQTGRFFICCACRSENTYLQRCGEKRAQSNWQLFLTKVLQTDFLFLTVKTLSEVDLSGKLMHMKKWPMQSITSLQDKQYREANHAWSVHKYIFEKRSVQPKYLKAGALNFKHFWKNCSRESTVSIPSCVKSPTFLFLISKLNLQFLYREKRDQHFRI